MKLFLFCFLCTGLLFGQQQNITLSTASFKELKVYDGLSVTIKKGPTNVLVISGEDPKNVLVVNDNGVLKIKMKFKKMFSGFHTFITLSYNSPFVLLDVNEEASVKVLEPIIQEVLEIRTQEGGQIKVPLNLEQLIAKAVTGGVIETSGTAKIQDISINTGGNYKGKTLKTSYTTITVNAGGKASIFAKDYVGASVKAGGRIQVFGNPEKMDKKTLFGGYIDRIKN